MDDRIKAAKDAIIAKIKELEPTYKVESNGEQELEMYNGQLMIDIELPKRECILDPWLPEQGIVMIHAKAGTGKTYFTLTAALAIALGKKFIQWEAPKPRRVLYIDGEMQGIKMQERLRHLLTMFPDYDKNIFADNFWIITPDLMKKPLPDLGTSEGQEYIIRYIQAKKIEVVVMDNVSCLMSSIKENEADSWSTVQDWELLLRRMGTSVIRIQHSGKNKAHRGSSKHQDIVDTTIHLQQPDDYQESDGARFIVNFEKHRGFHGTDSDAFEIKLINNWKMGTYWESATHAESIEKRVVDYFREGLSYKDIQLDVGLKAYQVNRIIKAAIQKGLISASEAKSYSNKHPKVRAFKDL